jgi:hypothetical protein
LLSIEHITNAQQIGLQWLAPGFDGGSAVLDFSIWYDEATQGAQWTEAVAGLSELQYTINGLVQGELYQFKVQARNEYGFSVYSEVESILAAQIPAQPAVPVTNWQPDNGSPSDENTSKV